jgi:chloramphenicol-sensitive protein RarD
MSTPRAPDGASSERAVGVASAVLAFGIWGVVPIFWKLLGDVPAPDQTAHRIVWSTAVYGALVVATGKVGLLRDALRPERARWFVVSGTLIAGNWLTYLYAVQHERIVEASLGYFINPLLNVMLGAWLLGERLTRSAQLAFALATAGVAILAWLGGAVPWISLLLAGSFATYGVVRKRAPADALVGSTVESAVLAPLALGWLALAGTYELGVTPRSDALLVASGVVTAAPLLGFSAAARRLNLSEIAFLQYLSPSTQLLVGVWVFGEPFGPGRAAAFGLIWAGCLVFTVDLARRAWKNRPR